MGAGGGIVSLSARGSSLSSFRRWKDGAVGGATRFSLLSLATVLGKKKCGALRVHQSSRAPPPLPSGYNRTVKAPYGEPEPSRSLHSLKPSSGRVPYAIRRIRIWTTRVYSFTVSLSLGVLFSFGPFKLRTRKDYSLLLRGFPNHLTT